MKTIIVLFLASLSVVAVAQEYVDDDPEVNRAVASAKKMYEELAPKLTPTNVPFSDFYRRPFTLGKHAPEIESSGKGKRAYVYAQVNFQIEWPSNRLVVFYNRILEKYIETNNISETPSLSAAEAVNCAKKYLDVMGVRIPSKMVLSGATFGKNSCPYSWGVGWQPQIDGYKYDRFLTNISQGILVVFHEKYGFVLFNYSDTWPLPKSTVVKVSREEAINKAEKAVPLVMKTSFYQMARLRGFKEKGLKKTELLISAPNWLLDPQRAVWIFDAPPQETRLCWVVTIETVDTVLARPKNANPDPPDILIYIDATTGEIVGANFT